MVERRVLQCREFVKRAEVRNAIGDRAGRESAADEVFNIPANVYVCRTFIVNVDPMAERHI